MTVRITKSEFNLREKISELDKPTGIKGLDLMRSDTSQDARDFISAGRKNLIINGAMEIAQRGTSTTTLGYQIDRFATGAANINNPTYAQVDVASGTQPYAAGFRKAARLTGGDNAVHSNDVLKFNQTLEAQLVAKSGWNYTSGASFITLSFWVKSSVGQTFFGRLQTIDGTDQNYPFSYDVYADTWTKVVKTIPGNVNIQMDNDVGSGLDIEWTLYRGVDTTASSTVVNKWQAYAASTRLPDGVLSTWHDTNGATWEITGVQLEVGRNATEFEHRSLAEELALCSRYYQQIGPASSSRMILSGAGNGNARIRGLQQLIPEMRLAPDVNLAGTENPTFYSYSGSPPSFTSVNSMESTTKNFHWDFDTGTHNQAGMDFDVKGSGAIITIDAEL